MPLKEILLHLDHTPRCRARVEIAANLAKAHQAHLSGFYATSRSYHSLHKAPSEQAAAETETLFREAAAQSGISADWCFTDTPEQWSGVCERVLGRAHYADLTIVGQAVPGSGERGVPLDLPERVVLGAGRPVLIIPHAGEFPSVGERILVAWRSGRASARALHDAIPLLERACQISAQMVNPPRDVTQEAHNLAAYLARHGISADFDSVSANDISAGNILLNLACDLSSDLVVLGVYPHNRLGKIDLGPVGKHFLEHMTVPVLMSR